MANTWESEGRGDQVKREEAVVRGDSAKKRLLKERLKRW